MECSFAVHIKEHQKGVELHQKQSQSEQNKSAVTDHVNIENHIINREEATITGR